MDSVSARGTQGAAELADAPSQAVLFVTGCPELSAHPSFQAELGNCSQGQTHLLLMESGKSFPFQSLFSSREEFSLSPAVS